MKRQNNTNAVPTSQCLLHFNIRPEGAKFLKIFEILTSFRSNFAYVFIRGGNVYPWQGYDFFFSGGDKKFSGGEIPGIPPVNSHPADFLHPSQRLHTPDH